MPPKTSSPKTTSPRPVTMAGRPVQVDSLDIGYCIGYGYEERPGGYCELTLRIACTPDDIARWHDIVSECEDSA